MDTRKVEDDIILPAGPNQVFDLLITPSQVRQWWGAAGAIIVPKLDGLWVATWGREDHPDYVSAYRITRFDPPRLLELTELVSYARSSTLPFNATFVVTFTVEPLDDGSRLGVQQDGFPRDVVADEFYQACADGWTRTLNQIREHVETS